MRVFRLEDFDSLTKLAKRNVRLRQHENIHRSYQEPVQRLFNAIEPKSYIRPHRHSVGCTYEMLIAVRGHMDLFIFDNFGNIETVIELGLDRSNQKLSLGVEIPSGIWHTVVARESGSVLLEIKEGPFDPDRPKEFAPWAPNELTPEAADYLAALERYNKTHP